MQIINRTPHSITILAAGAPADAPPVLSLPAADRGEVARVRQSPVPSGQLGTLPITSGGWGEIVGLPAYPEPGVAHIVSNVVAAAAEASGRGTADLYVPGDQVRDGTGRIRGSRGLTPGHDAFPRLGPVPHVVVFGSAARWLLAESDSMPRDVDVAYQGMDPVTARRLVERWMPDRSPLRRLPLDLRCLPARGDADPRAVCLPRPARLVAEETSVSPEVPLDQAWVLVFGGGGPSFTDEHTLPALIRRAARLAETVPHDVVADMLARSLLAWGGEIALTDDTTFGDTYRSSSVGALRGALIKLPAAVSLAVQNMAGCGMMLIRDLFYGRIGEEALDAIERGSPHGAGVPCLRWAGRGDHIEIGTAHGARWCASEAEALSWLFG